MSCDAFTDALSDWIDGTLPEERAREMREHAEGCERCRRLERDVRAMIGTLGELPRDDETRPRTWAAIEDRIRREGGTASPWTRWLSFAAVLVLALVGGWIASRPVRHEAPVAGAPSLPPALASADATLLEARAALDAVLAARQTKLSPETVRELEASLAEMESATKKIHEALAKDPGNRDLQKMLVASHRRQLSVMRDVTLLAATQETPR